MTVPAATTTRSVLGTSLSDGSGGPAGAVAGRPVGTRGERALPGPPIRVDTEPWFPPTPSTGSRRDRGRVVRQVLLTAVLSIFVLGVPTAATGVALVVLKPGTVVSTQQVPGEQAGPEPVSVGFVSAR